MPADQQPIPRPAARIILCDREGRILLFKARMLDRQFWITPGGGLNEGETSEQGVLRELWEETGLVADPADLTCIWTRSHTFEWRGRLLEQQERYFLLRCQSNLEITHANWEEDERNDLLEHRWWSVAEIEASEEVFAPRRLAELLRRLLRHGPPHRPFDVGI